MARIAVIGAGISGLTAAYLLRARHEVTLFEANSYSGGHTNTVEVEFDGEQHAIDTGFIVFNDWTYPNFVRLLDELEAPSRRTSMSFSVRCDRSGLEYNGTSLNGLFAQRRNLVRPSFYRMLADVVRFNRQAHHSSANAEDSSQPGPTVGEFLAAGGYSPEFAEQYLLPMGAAIWSCPTGTFTHFPMQFVIDFFRNHGLLNLRTRPTWRVVAGGSRTYVEAMLRRLTGRYD